MKNLHSQSGERISAHPVLKQAQKVLQSKNIKDFELFYSGRSVTKVEAKEGKIDSLTRAEDVGLAVRVIRDQKLGFSFTTSIEDTQVERAVLSAIEVAELMPKDENIGFANFKKHQYFSEKPAAKPSSTEAKVEAALWLEKLCLKADPRIQRVRQATVSETEYVSAMMDPSGNIIDESGCIVSASVSCKAEENGEGQMGGDYGFGYQISDLKLPEIANEAARTATELLGAGSTETMKCPAVIRNSVVSDLLGFLSGSFSAEEFDKGRSLLAGKMGQKIFAECVNLIDDGRLPGGLGTGVFDGEGVPAQTTPLVQNGVMKNWISDLYHSKKLGIPATGNASRSIKAQPSISTTNLVMPAGKTPFDQMIGSIDRGILIVDLMGVHTANPVTGDFSLGASGILIESGKLTRPVRGFAVAGNVLDLFAKITDIGSDQRSFGSVWCPSIRIAELSVGGQ
ncbi:MAG: TldD/PmbA family protein [Bdellovibrionales bacterium]|nr:TldD/PmbA family protein [Bdellovibrionales bacterium]